LEIPVSPQPVQTNRFGGGKKRSRRSTLRLESLEDRCVLNAPTIFTVSALGDAGAGTLRAAITGANASATTNNEIDFTVTGTITLESALPAISNSVDIDGPGSSSLTVTRDSAQGNFCIFAISASTTVNITGVEISGGQVAAAQGNGAGVQNNGTLELIDDSIDNNTSTVDGGGIYNSTTGSLIVYGSYLWSNNAVHGGGIYNDGYLEVESGSEIFTNGATLWGGGIYNSSTGTVSVLGGQQIFNNTAGTRGGGIYNLGAFTWTGSGGELTGNSADGYGGGIVNGGGATANLTGVTISGNSASWGGGFFVWSGTLNLTNCTISGNTADDGAAGGMYTSNGTYTTTNCTISDAIAQYTP
jgi:hypothetical protein